MNTIQIRWSMVWVMVAVLLSIGAPSAETQFPSLPKVKVPGKAPAAKDKNTPSAAKASSLPAPELSQISPDSVPPGGSGDVVLTGKNFDDHLSMRLNCHNAGAVVNSFKVEGPTRAVAHITMSTGAREGKCQVYLERHAGKQTAEMAESSFDSPEVYQVPESGPSFSVSNKSPMPVSVPAVLLAEGDKGFMELVGKMQQAMMPGFGQQGGKALLLLASDTVKYTKGGQTVFTEPVSNVKAVEEMNMQGQSTGIFRIVFKNGKIYNFMGGGADSSMDSKKVFGIVKAKLGK